MTAAKTDDRIGIPADALTTFVMREVEKRDARIEALVGAVAGFVWLGNNLHNIKAAPDTFRSLYESALVDARAALERPEDDA